MQRFRLWQRGALKISLVLRWRGNGDGWLRRTLLLWLGHLGHLMLLLLKLLVLLMLLMLLVLLLWRMLLNSWWHGLPALFLLHELLVDARMLRHRICMLVLWRGRRGLRLWCHLLSGLGVVEWRVGHVCVAIGWWWWLRGIWLWRSEI
jgi:hypothetical protein